MRKMSAKNRLLNASLLLLVAMLFVVFASEDSEAATHTVDKIGGSDYTNITHAVENASAGDTIRCLLYTSPSPRDRTRSRMPSSA